MKELGQKLDDLESKLRIAQDLKYRVDRARDLAILNTKRNAKTPTTLQQDIHDIKVQNQPDVDEMAVLDEIYPEYTGDTIEIDGKERTVFNSNGDRIAKSKEALTNFWRWFGDSKVVDEQGRPLVVYHGTPNGDFDTFYNESYFTADKEYADRYQHPSMSAIWTGKKASAPKTFAVYLKIEKLFTTTDKIAKDIFQKEYTASYSPDLAEDGNVDWVEAQDLIPYLMENYPEYDGIILSEGGERGISYVPFDGLKYEQKFNKTKNALQEIVNGVEESTVKDLRDDLSQYGGTNDITFIWGNDKKGIQHIVKNHGVEVLPKIIDAVVDGKIKESHSNNKVIIEKNGIDVVLKLTENGKSKSWLITGYDTSISKDAEREFRATLNATQNLPTFGRQELGAMLTTISLTQAYKNVNPQIKSVDNRGIFGNDTGNIYYQSEQKRPSGKGNRGAYVPALRLIIKANSMTPGTLSHEFAHDWFEQNYLLWRSGNGTKEFNAYWQSMMSAMGIDETASKKDIEKASEVFARAFESWLLNKTDFAKSVDVDDNVFKEYQKHLQEIYTDINNPYFASAWGEIGVLKPEIKAWFDRVTEIPAEQNTFVGQVDKAISDFCFILVIEPSACVRNCSESDTWLSFIYFNYSFLSGYLPSIRFCLTT